MGQIGTSQGSHDVTWGLLGGEFEQAQGHIKQVLLANQYSRQVRHALVTAQV